MSYLSSYDALYESMKGNKKMPAAAYIVPAAISAVAAIWGAKKSSDTTKSVTAQTIAAQQQAGAQEDIAAQRQLDFLRQSDASDRVAAEAQRRQDYDLTTTTGLNSYNRGNTSDLNSFTLGSTSGLNNYNLSEAQRRGAYNQNETARRTTYDERINRQNNINPYIQLGTNSMKTLAHLLGQNPGPVNPTVMADPKTATPWIPNPYNTAPGYVMPKYDPGPGYVTAPYTPMPTASPLPQTLAGVANAGGAQPQPGSMVPMIGPDGTRKNVPAEQVAYYQQQGARVAES